MRDEDKAQARQHFSTPLLFSIHEAKGLEYENIVLYRFVSDHRAEFGEIVEGVRAEDLQAVASYLAQLPAEPLRDAPAGEGSARLLALGAKLYEKHCADCHGAQGEGAVDGSGRMAYPPLAGNPSLLQPTARNLARVIQEGGFAPSTAAHPRPYGMPPHRFTDTELAALLTHLRRSWGHQASTVDEVEVLRWR